MTARAKFKKGDRVRLSAYGREREAERDNRGKRSGPTMDRTRGAVLGFSTKHPTWVYVQRVGFADRKRPWDIRFWEIDPDAPPA